MAGPAVGRLHPGRPGETKGQPKLVDVLSVRPRTRVRFPPPPCRPRGETLGFPPSTLFARFRRVSAVSFAQPDTERIAPALRPEPGREPGLYYGRGRVKE